MKVQRSLRGENAVIYLRVSTKEQAEDPHNLENQEKRCRAYCQQMGLNVLHVFIDRGESGRTSDRPEFQRMLAFCKTARNNVRYVVVQDLSRFARNHLDQAEAIGALGLSGVRLRSTFESNIDETAAGKLAANIFGAFNQYFSDAHSEKQRVRKRDAVAAGRVPWRAPLGYLNVQSKAGANIEPDPVRAPLILEGFQLIDAGQSKATALKIITDKGLRTVGGAELSAQTFDHILVNPLYAGWVTLPSNPELEPVKGQYQAIVPQDLFDRVQAILAGRKPKRTKQKSFNPDFSLRHITHCANCDRPITGAFCKGRTNLYPRYWCSNSECTSRVSESRADLEAAFMAFLRRLRPSQDVLADLPTIAKKIWTDKHGNSERELRKLSQTLQAKKREKLGLVLMRSRGELSTKEFEEAKTASSLEISKIEMEVSRLDALKTSAEFFVRFASSQAIDLANVWELARPDLRQRLQDLLFGTGLEYSRALGFWSQPNTLLFPQIERAMQPH